MEASVEENLPTGAEVVRVKAKSPVGAPITYRLVGGSGLGRFAIDAASGVVTTTTTLDYEKAQHYWLVVRAEDSSPASSTLYSHLHLLVRLVNMNDHAPIFSRPMYFAKVEENSAEGKEVLKVEATDLDSPLGGKGSSGGVRYAIVKGNPQSNFVIDESSGHVTTGKRRLDRETQAEHELTIRACDQGQPQICTTTIAGTVVIHLTTYSLN